MRYSFTLVVGLVSLPNIISAVPAGDQQAPAKRWTYEVPFLSHTVTLTNCDDAYKDTCVRTSKVLPEKRSFTTVQGSCTAICADNLMTDCTFNCPTPKPDPEKRGEVAVTVTDDHFTKAAPVISLQHRALTFTKGDCTALCWDQMPGTGCDVQCKDFPMTGKPATGTEIHPPITIVAPGYSAVCIDLMPGKECQIDMTEPFPTQTTEMSLVPRMPLPTPKPASGPPDPSLTLGVWTSTQGDCVYVIKGFGLSGQVDCEKKNDLIKAKTITPTASGAAYTLRGNDIHIKHAPDPSSNFTFVCIDLEPRGISCNWAYDPPALHALGDPGETTMVNDRRDAQARQAFAARLARKFGNVKARDDTGPGESAISAASAALAAASTAISESGTMTAPVTILPPTASVGEAESSLSSMSPPASPGSIATFTLVPATSVTTTTQVSTTTEVSTTTDVSVSTTEATLISVSTSETTSTSVVISESTKVSTSMEVSTVTSLIHSTPVISITTIETSLGDVSTSEDTTDSTTVTEYTTRFATTVTPEDTTTVFTPVVFSPTITVTATMELGNSGAASPRGKSAFRLFVAILFGTAGNAFALF